MTNQYLEVLGLQQGATPDEIKKAYRQLAKEYHPDLNQSAEAKLQFIKIHEAYKFLEEVDTTSVYEEIKYDKPPEKSEYDLWKEQARKRARQQAMEAAAYKRRALKKIYKYFNFIAVVVMVCNFVLFADYFSSPNIFKEQVVDHYQVRERSGEGGSRLIAYDVIEFETFSVAIPPNELRKVTDFSNTQVRFTPILNVFLSAEFGVGKNAVVITPEYNIYDVFSGLVPLVLVSCLAYFYLKDKNINKLPVLLFISFGFAIEITMFFTT